MYQQHGGGREGCAQPRGNLETLIHLPACLWTVGENDNLFNRCFYPKQHTIERWVRQPLEQLGIRPSQICSGVKGLVQWPNGKITLPTPGFAPVTFH